MLESGAILQQNRYRIEEPLGEGGMGAVYRAWHLGLEKHVAIKEMVPQPGLDTRMLEPLRAQFKREAVTLARLNHPHLVRVLDSFQQDGNAYLVMDMVEGESLAQRIRRLGRLSEAEVKRWAREMLDALTYCHAQGVIHRDIKPHNIVICPDGRAVLVDFGLVKLWDPNDPRTQTVMRGMGTPEYAPPEQYDAQAGHTDGRSDLYGLGATLYHALTGTLPPTATQRIVNPEALAPLHSIVPDVSAGLEKAVMRALALRPDHRFQSAPEMLAALEDEAPATVPPPIKPSGPAAPAQDTTDYATTIMDASEQTSASASASAAQPGAARPGIPRHAEEKKRRKLPIWVIIVGILLLLCLCIGVRAGSRIQKRNADEPTAPVVQDEPVDSDATPEPDDPEVPAEPVEPEPPAFRIGLVTGAGSIEDGGFNQQAWTGVLQAQEVFGAQGDFIESGSEEDYVRNIRAFAEDGYDIIVTVGFALAGPTLEMAREYPETHFIGVDQHQDKVVSNLAGLIFHEDRAGYLAGTLAAYLSESGLVAGVMGPDTVPQVVAFKEGYQAGAHAAEPAVEVRTVFHPGEITVAFNDPAWGAETATALIEEGADVIFVAAGTTGNGALEAAARYEGVRCIGVDTDQWETVPEARPCLVSSAVKRIDQGVLELVGRWVEGSFPGGNVYGEVGLAPFHDFEPYISDELRMNLIYVETGLREGTIDTGYAP